MIAHLAGAAKGASHKFKSENRIDRAIRGPK